MSTNFPHSSGAALYVQYKTNIFLRQTSFIDNYATNNQGHQIMTYNGSEGTPSITLVNTNFTHVSSTGNFYGYQSNVGGSPDKFIPPQTCASNPCTVFPFTGTCTNRTGNLGVFCDYDEATTCPANEYKQFVAVENGLPPSTAICADTKPEWDCAAAKGVFKRTEDWMTEHMDCPHIFGGILLVRWEWARCGANTVLPLPFSSPGCCPRSSFLQVFQF